MITELIKFFKKSLNNIIKKKDEELLNKTGEWKRFKIN